MEKHGREMVDLFAGRNAQQKELLADVQLRSATTFDREYKLDLGGVAVRLLWFGGAHTKGDELVFVDPDRTLISGDVVQNKVVPNIYGDGGTPAIPLAIVASSYAPPAVDDQVAGAGRTSRAYSVSPCRPR